MATMKTLNGYGFNATELNGKAASDYLQKTDTASDSAKLGGKAPEYYIQPRNLLDNSDFRNPVNQRGQTDYTSNGYTIDRWELYFGAVGVTSLGYITTSGQMYQKIAIPTDKVYTFAIKNDAGIALVTGIPANGISSATLGNALIKLATINGYVEVVIEPSEGHNLAGAYWAALYEGSYTAETLPPYVPKGYAAELMECQRYFIADVGTHKTGTIIDNIFEMYILLPTQMRIVPTAILKLPDNVVFNIGERKIIAVKSASVTYFKNLLVGITLDIDNTGKQYAIGATYLTRIDLSADL